MAPDPIKHVVVLMLENHSFDQMLGSLSSELPGLDGIDPFSPGANVGCDGRKYHQVPSVAESVSPDPMHELVNVLRQLDGNNGGFVKDYVESHAGTTAEQWQQVMSYFPAGFLEALHELARHFTVCNRWFSSVPGPTWANRFFVHSGTSVGRVRMMDSAIDAIHPSLYIHFTQETIYDRLNEGEIAWRIYHGDIPQSLVLSHQQTIENASKYSFLDRFYDDATLPEADFPAYCFIEPSYMPPGQNDDHPPHTTIRAQQLLARVYNALRANDSLWKTTLLVVLYDEHGGFYDHVSPPSTVSPDDYVRVDYDGPFAFDRLGVRVPALLVSPWVDRTVVSDEFDHTSLLKYLIEKWNLAPMTRRVDAATSIGLAIRTSGSPREDTPPSLQVHQPLMAAANGAQRVPEIEEPLNSHQLALIAFSEELERGIEEPAGKPQRAAVMMAGPPLSQVDVAKERVHHFLRQQKVKAFAARPMR